MSDKPFVHLHCHSHYSLLDGASSIKKLIQRAKDHGMNALALTDHGNLHGALEFYQKSKAADLKPIVGYEAYIAPGSRSHKESGNLRESAFHLTLLAQNRVGYKNLMRMASAAHLEGFYFKPRIDKELLQECNEGIICLSGCVSSELNRALLKGYGGEEHLTEAMEIARWFRDFFGDRYFIEIMNNGVDVQRLALEGAVDVAKQLDIPLVATSDCHYVDPDDAEAQDVMLCINTGKFRTDTSRMRMDGNEYYLRTPDEMYAAFPGLEDAVARSQEIADSVDIDLELGKRHFPTYAPLPEGETAQEFLRRLCLEGLKDRYAGNEKMFPGGELSDTVMARLDRELSVINKLGFPNYFLIVWDFVREARDMAVPTTARGSGVGALVCYALYLSHVCPIEYDLLFERFLDENRLEAPDIDIDFCKEHRADVMRYVKDKYGEDNVAQIGTFGTLQARAAIKDVGRVLGIPLTRVNEVTAMVPEELHITLEGALEKSGELQAAYETDGEIREMIDLARKIEGLARNIGTHAAAVVIADKPLTEYVPLCRISGKEDIITQWSMNDVEAAGLLKMDFLGLRNLTILRKTVDLVEQTTGERIDPHKLPLDDKATYALLQRGETKGVFQLESGGIRDLLQRMKPDRFLDIVATNALYRPGPLKGGMVDEYVDVKLGKKQPQYKHPVLKELLEETNGVMVYQEQIMRILNRLGGIELAKAYTCIKAISKKKKEIIDANHDAFITGSTANGLGKKDAQDIWDMLLEFAGYGFNKSHSTAYALIAYQTAYLKTHYPVEFMAALLSSDIPGRNFKKKDSLAEHMDDSERMGIEIVPPDVNSSDVDFSVSEGKIYFALSAIKGCGGGAADSIVVARKNEGPFKDLFDFCERVDVASCNRSTIETLIKAGAMDSFEAKRSQLMAVIERAMQSGAAALADRRSGQKSLFGDMEDEQDKPIVALPDIPELNERELSLMEKEVLGFYRTSHPLAEYEQKLSEFCSHTTADVAGLPERADVIMGGMLSSLKIANTRKPRAGSTVTKYANFDLEDKHGIVRCIAWPDEYLKYGELVQPEAVLVIRGTIDRRGGGDDANLVVNEVIPLSELESRYTSGMIVCIDEADSDDKTLKQLYEIVRGYPGGRDVFFLIRLEDGSRIRLKSNKVRVDITPELRTRVDDLLGPGRLRLIISPPTPSAGKRNGKRRNGAARGA